MGLFKTPKMPQIEPATPLPDKDQATAARRRLMAKETAGTGARSTILAGGGRETLGA